MCKRKGWFSTQNCIFRDSIYRLCILGAKASRKPQAKQNHGKKTQLQDLLECECVVSVEESEAVSTGLQLSKAVLAVPVLVTAEIVGV